MGRQRYYFSHPSLDPIVTQRKPESPGAAGALAPAAFDQCALEQDESPSRHGERKPPPADVGGVEEAGADLDTGVGRVAGRGSAPGRGRFAGHIVAIGASAGGLDALERLFQMLCIDTGAAFVVIQHLSPDHKSMMANLLGRHTAMPVVMVEDEMAIEANRVYLIPPGSIMHVAQRHLRLTPKNPRGLTLPIDVFFSSLAEQYGPRSIGVILSGTGSDGTRGAVAINEAGGFLIAQEPESAKFDGMPRSAIATGFIDAILAPEEIGPRVLAHIRKLPQPKAAAPQAEAASAPASGLTPEEALLGIQHLLLQLGGVDFDDYKPATILRRIERRMQVRQVARLGGYLALITEDRSEALALKRELLIPVTSFFRDPDAFDVLAGQAVGPIVATKQGGDSVRVWIAGVSTGEEAYSIAMLFVEEFERNNHWPHLKIFATDVEQQNIEIGSAGVYPESMAAEVAPERVERFFLRRGTQFLIRPELRQSIVFARHNLLADPPFTKMDLVVCRNTLIYFKSHAQERALRRLQYALAPGGFLFLGSSESLGAVQRDFAPVDARHKLFRVLRPASLPITGSESPLSLYHRSPRVPALPVPKAPGSDAAAIDASQTALMRAYVPPALVVNGRHEIIHLFGRVDIYLHLREGGASLELARLLPKNLVPVASALLYKASKENATLVSDSLHVPNDEGSVDHLRLCARSLGEIGGERFVLLVFEPLEAPTAPPPGGHETGTETINVGAATVERVEILERELAATRESLQATIEELETSNEELQATNEELMSSNEELQSSNEELQSVNEELNTVNAENQEKIEIQNRINADLDSMAKAASLATIFVDQDLNLTRFSPDAVNIFKLRDTDIGRRLDDFRHTLEYPGLIEDLRMTLVTGEVVEREAKGPNGKIYLVRMLPYRIPSCNSKGAVATFVDVTSFYDAERLQNVLDALAEHVAVLDPQGMILMVNAAWRRFARDNGDPRLRRSGPGVNYLDACPSRGDGGDETAARAAAGLREVLVGQLPAFSLQYPCHAPDRDRWFLMHATPIRGTGGGAVVSHIEITPWYDGPRGATGAPEAPVGSVASA